MYMKISKYLDFNMFGYNNKIVQKDLLEMSQAPLQWFLFQEKTILVTGANSMLGTYMTYLFLFLASEKRMNIKVVILTRNLAKTNELYKEFIGKPCLEIIHQDITQPIRYTGRIDYVFHFAGNASPYFINSDPVGILKSNLIGAFNVMELARDKESQCVVLASTREVYGASNVDALSETSFGSLNPMDNRSCYPESKRASESVFRSYYLQYGVKGISVRIAHSYGPGMKIEGDGRVMADFIGDVVHHRDIVLKSTGEAVRAFCYITDTILGLIQISLYGRPGEAYNLANETEPLSIREIARMICSLFPEREIKVKFAGEQSKVGYCTYPRVALDTKKIESIGFLPCINLEEGLARTVRSFEE